MGYAVAGHERTDDAERLRSPSEGRGAVVDRLRSDRAPAGRSGTGTIHHVAFRAETAQMRRDWRERLIAAGLDVTPVIDRQCCEAIDFRAPGGVLFEIATDPPGFAVDEAPGAPGVQAAARARAPPRRDRASAVALERLSTAQSGAAGWRSLRLPARKRAGAPIRAPRRATRTPLSQTHSPIGPSVRRGAGGPRRLHLRPAVRVAIRQRAAAGYAGRVPRRCSPRSRAAVWRGSAS